MTQTRRHICLKGLGTLAAVVTSSPLAAWAQPAPRRLRMLLNTAYSGPQAWLLLARDNGHLAREGLEIEFTTGAGAYTAAPRMVDGGFDLGYGDVNSLIEVVAAQPPQTAPVGVFMMFNASPSTIAVRADGPIRLPKDLEGRAIVGHSTDVALRTFGAFCSRTGIERSRVRVRTSIGGMRSMADDVLSDDVQGMFGYVSTIVGAMATAGPAALAQLRFLKYAEHVPDLYGSVLMASRRLLQQEPATVARVVRAFNSGLADMLRDPGAGIAAVARQAAGIDRDAERQRWQTTLDVEMGHADGRNSGIGIGDIDAARLERAIALIARTNDLPRVPALHEVFVRDHLPPPSERVRTVAAARTT